MLFSLLAAVPVLVSAAGPEAGRWEMIGKSRTGTCWYVDIETPARGRGDPVSFWLKSVPDKASSGLPEDAEQTEDILKRIQERYFGDYEYTEALWELSCTRPAFRILYFCAYDVTGAPIFSRLTPDAEWSLILPGSVGEIIFEALCRHD